MMGIEIIRIIMLRSYFIYYIKAGVTDKILLEMSIKGAGKKS